ncbi:hypothetical protein JCM8547_006789 [Rhodosporidiobolus lusitaniae]
MVKRERSASPAPAATTASRAVQSAIALLSSAPDVRPALFTKLLKALGEAHGLAVKQEEQADEQEAKRVKVEGEKVEAKDRDEAWRACILLRPLANKDGKVDLLTWEAALPMPGDCDLAGALPEPVVVFSALQRGPGPAKGCLKAPKVKLVAGFFHPNVYPSGTIFPASQKPSLGCLDEATSGGFSSALQHLQITELYNHKHLQKVYEKLPSALRIHIVLELCRHCLAFPNNEDPVQLEAYHVAKKELELFKTKMRGLALTLLPNPSDTKELEEAKRRADWRETAGEGLGLPPPDTHRRHRQLTMRSSFSLLAAVAALSSRAFAQSVPATATAEALALVDAQYANSGLDNQGNAGFGVSLEASAILSVVYPSFGVVQNGETYTVDQVADQPDILVTPSEETAAWFNSSTAYTLALADASSLGDPDTRGNYRHFLGNGFTGAAASGSNLTFGPENGEVITSYAAPGPIEGTGPHRYAWLLFTEPSGFQAPANLSSPGTSAAPWYVSDYVSSTGLQLVAASFFVVQNGEPTGSVASTEAVNTATLSVSSAASSGASSTSGSASATSASASASSSGGSNGAGKVAVSLAAGALGLLGVAALA